MSVPQTILATRFRLLRFGNILTVVGLGVAGHLQYQIVICVAFFILVDCCVVNWLRASHDSDDITKITRRVCNTCQLACFISQVACMQFYNEVPMVRATFLMTIPSFMAGCSRDAKEAFVVLLASFMLTATVESEPAFLLAEITLSSWMIFGAWKGQKLIEQTQQEATLFFVQCSERMMQQALTVLLDCSVVMEQVAAEPPSGHVALGAPLQEAPSAPEPVAWRVVESNPPADHFFGAPVAGTDLRDMIRSIADHRRFDEALHAAAQIGEHARMVSNVNLRCSTLAGAAASFTQRGPSVGDIPKKETQHRQKLS
ncbi:unnamed protein product [Prorocentrum cordatum]|uniref:Uncharacterized protein n=1 Tax=Prorocentrum cordatum TaxID=2364126 RepID=A0ABN9XWU0_9DINO|nr:unnamed protein product [Polarella glacialis]